MQKVKLVIAAILLFQTGLHAQVSQETISGLRAAYMQETSDSAKMYLAGQLANGYRFSKVDSANYYNDLARELAVKQGLGKAEAELLSLKSAIVLEEGKLPEALQYGFEALELAEKVDYVHIVGLTLNRIGNVYMELEDYRKALDYYQQSAAIFKKTKKLIYYNEMSNIGHIYERLGMADSALYYLKPVLTADPARTDKHNITYTELMFRLGNAYKLAGDTVEALRSYKEGIAESIAYNDTRNLVMNDLFLAALYNDMNVKDSSYVYAKAAVAAGNSINFRKGVYEASSLLNQLYREQGKWDSAYQYLHIAAANKDSIIGATRFRKLQTIILEEQQRQRQAETLRIAKENRQKQLFLLGGSLVLLTIAFLQYRNIRQKQKANKVLEKTLGHLKATQAQLIQSEKMASLGELTAGIAHEIQNPLNFVNNFSELNTELADELTTELKAGNLAEASNIAETIKDNEAKINLHGKRAEGIVKAMLQHTHASSGTKEPHDINALADECLRLAYHGFRGKDKTFQSGFTTTFDPSIGKVNIVQQDIARVLLNLINNAFYAVNEKRKLGIPGYEPLVHISTFRDNSEFRIEVKDNGSGIPSAHIKKIFQPFFTTKPTGEGTGLGLSLSYDMVKAHGGELKVESLEGEGSEFIIQIPIITSENEK